MMFWIVKIKYLLVIGVLLFQSCSFFHHSGTSEAIDKNEFLIKEASVETKKIKEPDDGRVSDSVPLRLTVESAGLLALSNNRNLKVVRLNPEILRTYEDEEKSRFDVTLKGSVFFNELHSGKDEENRKAYQGGLSLEKLFSSGTVLSADTVGIDEEKSSGEDSDYTAKTALTVTQPVLKGVGSEFNLVGIEKANIAIQISEYEVRGYVENLIYQVENAYWDYSLALRRVDIVKESLNLSIRQLQETEDLILVGKMAEVERVSVQAEEALQKQQLINVNSELETAKLNLLRLLNVGGDNSWEREIILGSPPSVPDFQLKEIKNHVESALRMRPEINQARLEIERHNLEIVYTRNGLLPKLDLFLSLGKTGYSDSFGNAVEKSITDENYEFTAGLSFEYPLSNNLSKSRHARSGLSLQQAENAMKNLSQLIELDIRSAYIRVTKTKDQILAGIATRRLQEEKLRVEAERFRVGRSTNFLVSQAQRDLMAAKINEVESLVSHIKATVDFLRLEGSLLVKRNLIAPGGTF